MKTVRFLVGLAVAIFVAAVAMYVVSLWTGELLGGPVFSTRLALILILFAVLVILVPRLGKGTLPHRLWSWIMAAIIINVIPVTMETINAFAGRHVFSPDLIFLFFLFVFIPVLVVIGLFYFGLRKQGFTFSRRALLSVLPSMLVVAVVTVVVLIIPTATSDVDIGVRISDIFAVVVQIAALCVVSFMAITIGEGEAGKPFLYIAFALVCIIIQTVLTAHIRLVSIMSTTEPADIFLHIAYLLLIFAAYFQFEMSAGRAVGG